ncbi:autotransporter outer membrane beta-barrel domain-containing protein, partial [Pseudochrobactrum kiredjianiae]
MKHSPQHIVRSGLKHRSRSKSAYRSLLCATCATIGLLAGTQAFAAAPACNSGVKQLDVISRISTPDQTFTGTQNAPSVDECAVWEATGAAALIIVTGAGVLGNIILENSGTVNISAGGQVFGYAEAGESVNLAGGNALQNASPRGGIGNVNVSSGGFLGAALIGAGSTLTVDHDNQNLDRPLLGRIKSSGTVIVKNATMDSKQDLQFVYNDAAFRYTTVFVTGGTMRIENSLITGITTGGQQGIYIGQYAPSVVAGSTVQLDLIDSTINGVANGITALIDRGLHFVLNITNTDVTVDANGIGLRLDAIQGSVPAAFSMTGGSLTGGTGLRIADSVNIINAVISGTTIVGLAGAPGPFPPPGMGVVILASGQARFTNATKITGDANGVFIQGAIFQATTGAQIIFEQGTSVEGKGGAAILVDGSLINGEAGRTDATVTVRDAGTTLKGVNNRLLDVVNQGQIQFNADTVTLTGDMVADADSSMNIALQKSTSMNGNITLGDTVEVSGDSIWTVAGGSSVKHLIVGGTDKGVVTLGGTASFSSDNAVTIARDAGSTGILNIGAAPADAATNPGAFAVSSVAFGQGDGTINFNHTSSGYLFGAAMSGKGTVNQISGKTILTGDSTYTGATTIAAGSTLQLGNGGETGSITSDVANAGSFIFNRSNDLNYVGKISGDGVFEQVGAGKAVLGGDSSGFAGSSFVRSGILAVDGTLGGTMDVVAGRLQGIGTVGSTTHEAGATIMPGNGGFETLTIKGDYIGKGGTVEIATVLGNDNSQTSRLAITGSTSGTGNVHVTNRDGLGSYTTEGIRIISVGGSSDATFTLQGNAVTKDGQQAVVQGAYSYTLEKNGIASPQDGAWYLRSVMPPVTPPINPPVTPPVTPPRYNPGTPVYEGYGQTMQALNKLPTLQQRVGNRYWSGAANPVIEQGADALGTPLVPADATIDTRGIWGRIEGAHNRFEASRSTTAMKQDVDTFI